MKNRKSTCTIFSVLAPPWGCFMIPCTHHPHNKTWEIFCSLRSVTLLCSPLLLERVEVHHWQWWTPTAHWVDTSRPTSPTSFMRKIKLCSKRNIHLSHDHLQISERLRTVTHVLPEAIRAPPPLASWHHNDCAHMIFGSLVSRPLTDLGPGNEASIWWAFHVISTTYPYNWWMDHIAVWTCIGCFMSS